MSPRKATDITAWLAEDMVRILDFLSRVVGAADNGSSDYMHDKARQLANAANAVHRRLSDTSDRWPLLRHDPSKQFDPARLRALIARDAKHYAAGRALYPLDGDPTAAARRRALESAATEMMVDPPAGFSAAQGDVIAMWLRARAEREVSG